MKKIEIMEETYFALVARQHSMLAEKMRNKNNRITIPTFDEVFKKMENDILYVNDENTKLVYQLLFNEIKPFYMSQKHFDETKELREKMRKNPKHNLSNVEKEGK